MRKKCHGCLCASCIKSCKCRECKGKTKSCNDYNRFIQMSIFDLQPRTRHKPAPRHSWQYYGISDERYRMLTEYIQSGKYDSLVSSSASMANKDIAEYILMSVIKKLSYDELQKRWDLRKIKRMPCCRTDFYGYRRLFYHLLDLKIRNEEENKI